MSELMTREQWEEIASEERRVRWNTTHYQIGGFLLLAVPAFIGFFLETAHLDWLSWGAVYFLLAFSGWPVVLLYAWLFVRHAPD